MSKKEEIAKTKTEEELIDMLTKKKQVSASIINLFKEIDNIKKTEIDPLIKKVKNDPSDKNRAQLRYYYVGLTQLETNILNICHERIIKTLAEVENINNKEESESEHDSSEESESSEEESEEETTKKNIKSKPPAKKKTITKKNSKKVESDDSD